MGPSPSEGGSEGLKINFVGLEERGIRPAKRALLYAEQGDNVHDAGSIFHGSRPKRTISNTMSYP